LGKDKGLVKQTVKDKNKMIEYRAGKRQKGKEKEDGKIKDTKKTTEEELRRVKRQWKSERGVWETKKNERRMSWQERGEVKEET
jgi:hypothetical protein